MAHGPPRRGSHVAFTCDFARRNCPHATVFHDAYQRTNRTRGTKILRCFPHCCPRHVERSYCGGPVYLQVDLALGELSDIDDMSLCVFAHFHPKAMPGLALGQFVARSMFRANQQTDTNATGEWIGARLMASADHSAWMFEVNPSGRWYYQWESGATKAQRATEHVFEAYVMILEAAIDRCEVVAKAVSREFKMISFRRAPTESKATTPANDEAAMAFPDANDRDSKHTGEEEAASEPRSQRWIHRDSLDSVVSSDAELASQLESLMPREAVSGTISSPQVDEVRRQSRQLQYTPSPPRASRPSTATRSIDQHEDRTALSLRPSPQILTISHQLGSLVDLVQMLPSTALQHATQDISRVVLAPFTHELRHENVTFASLLAPPRAFEQPAGSPFPPALVSVVLRLALWFVFDQELELVQEEYVERAAAGLLDKVALYESYFAWLERLQHLVQAFLSSQGISSTLSGLARDARRLLCPFTAAAASSASECRGLESFVAQTREVFLAGGDLRPRQRRLSTTSARPVDGLLARELRDLRLFSTMWVVDVNSIEWRDLDDSASHAPSAFVMMWTWRQALAVEITLDESLVSSPLTLIVSSLWNPSRGRTTSEASPRGSRLVLDGKPRWLRMYPSGESSSSVQLGAQRLGHYVASFRRESRELLVNLYTWPWARSREQASCYCVRWSLRLDPEHGTLAVRVAVELGRLRRGTDTAALDESPLTHKLQAVAGWTTVASLQYACHRH